MMPEEDSTPANPELKVDLDHLDPDTKKQFLKIKNKYPKLYSTHKHHVGRFTGFTAEANIDPKINCRQKQRGRFLPKSAKDDLNRYFDSGVFCNSTGGVDRYACNITLTRRPAAKEMKFATRADKNIARLNEKSQPANDKQSDNKTTRAKQEDRVLYRLTIDMRTLNSATRNDTTIVLPTIESIERDFHGCNVTTLDLSNMFYNIKVSDDSIPFFNFYVEESVWSHSSLPQGWCASPKFARDAMIITFAPEIMKDFAIENNLSEEDFPFRDYDQILKQFVDDLAVFTKRDTVKSYKGKFSATELHMLAIDSVFYALARFGWLISLRKSTILQDSFVFLGATWDMSKETIGINSDRLDSILAWREPRSVAEMSSRLSSLMYYESMALWLKRLAYPLYVMVKRGIFVWTKVESHSWHNVLFMMALGIKNAIFNPKHPLILLNDTSAVETSGFVCQWNPGTCQLCVLKAKSHILTEAQRRASPVHRESQGTHFMMDSARPYLLQTECPVNYLFVDASSISYIARVKPFENFLFELACRLSEYPSLMVVHAPGRVLSAPDLLTRQLNDVIFEREDTNISKHQAHILPILEEKIKPGEIISNQALYEILNATPASEFFDVSEKNYTYTQRVNWSDYAKPDQLFSSEKEFIIASMINHDDSVLKLQTIQDIFSIKSSNAQFKTRAGKLQFLAQIREKLKSLTYNTVELQRITHFLNEQEKAVEAPMKRRTIDTRYAVIQHELCENCSDCPTLDQPDIKTSIYDPKRFLASIRPMIDIFEDQHFKTIFDCYDNLKCKNAKRLLAAQIIQDVINACTESVFTFDNEKMFVFSHFFQSEHCDLKIDKEKIVFSTTKPLQLEPAEILQLDFILHTKTTLSPTLTVNEEINILIAPNLLREQTLYVEGLSLYNMSNSNISLPKGTHLFSIHFVNINSILAVPITKESVIKKASFDQNVINFSFIDILTKLIGNLGQRSIHDDKLHNLNKMNARQAKEKLRGHRQRSVNKAASPISTQACQVSVKNACKKRLEGNQADKNNIDHLSSSQEQTALNATFLLQALMKKDFGLRPTDIRAMQLHDRRLAKEISKFELPNKVPDPDTKFHMRNGILYHSSKTGALQLCVSPIIAESVAFHLHNDAIFHHPARQLYDTMTKLLYTPDLGTITTRITNTCSVCLLGQPKIVKKLTGSQRTTIYLPGECLVCDSAFLPKCSRGYSKILILVDACTSKISAYPSRDLTSRTAKNHIYNHILATSIPRVISIDHGQEFQQGLGAELASMNISLEATTPYVKGTTAIAEASVRLLKRALKKACLYNPSSWSDNLPLIVNALNNSRLYNKTTRNQIYYSPLHYANRLNIMGLQDLPEMMFDEQWESLQQIMETRKHNLQLNSTKNMPIFRKNQLVSDHSVPQTHHGTSAELEPSVHGIFKIKEVMHKRLRVINVITGEERTLPTELVRPINLENLVQMKFSLQNAYVHSHFNRLMKQNKYLGPDERKTWRNSVGDQPSLHVKNASSVNYDINPVEKVPSELNDPDCPARRTRSGQIYHTVCAQLKPIISPSASPSPSMEDFLKLTPSSLKALQKGLQATESHLTKLETQALKIQQKDLYPSYQLSWNQPTPRKSKKVTISDNIQVRNLDRDISLKIEHPQREICTTVDTINTLFLGLDFSTHELFLQLGKHT